MCDKIQKLIKPWREEDIPVICWKDFVKRVQMELPALDDEILKRVTSYLHLTGEVCLMFFDKLILKLV